MPVFQENYEFDLTEKICRAMNKAGSEVIKTMEIQSGCKILVSLDQAGSRISFNLYGTQEQINQAKDLIDLVLDA